MSTQELILTISVLLIWCVLIFENGRIHRLKNDLDCSKDSIDSQLGLLFRHASQQRDIIKNLQSNMDNYLMEKPLPGQKEELS